MTLKKDLIVILTEVEKELALREQYRALHMISAYKKSFIDDLIRSNTNPEVPLHSVIYTIIMRLLDSQVEPRDGK